MVRINKSQSDLPLMYPWPESFFQPRQKKSKLFHLISDQDFSHETFIDKLLHHKLRLRQRHHFESNHFRINPSPKSSGLSKPSGSTNVRIIPIRFEGKSDAAENNFCHQTTSNNVRSESPILVDDYPDHPVEALSIVLDDVDKDDSVIYCSKSELKTNSHCQKRPPSLVVLDDLSDNLDSSTSKGSIHLPHSSRNLESEVINMKTLIDNSQPSNIKLQETESNASFKTSVNPAPNYPIYDVLKTNLDKEDRLVDYVRGDGNCFFRALSKLMYGTDTYHKAVRSLIVDIIATNKSKFAQFIDKENVQAHVETMSEDHSWATTCEIYAAATLLQRDIYIYTPNHTNDKYSWLLFRPVFKRQLDETELKSQPCCYITLCNTNGNHYDCVVPNHGRCNCFLPFPELDGIYDSVDLTAV